MLQLATAFVPLAVHAVTSEDLTHVPPGLALHVLDPTRPSRRWRATSLSQTIVEAVTLRRVDAGVFPDGATLIVYGGNCSRFDVQCSDNLTTWQNLGPLQLTQDALTHTWRGALALTVGTAQSYLRLTPLDAQLVPFDAAGWAIESVGLILAADLVAFEGELETWPVQVTRAVLTTERVGGPQGRVSIGRRRRVFSFGGALWRREILRMQLQPLRALDSGAPVYVAIGTDVFLCRLAAGYGLQERAVTLATTLTFSEF